MLQSLRYILTIAANERAMLYRTPKFWVLAGIGGFFTFVVMLGTTIAAIVDASPDSEFSLTGTDAWIALYFFSYIQTIIIIFVAGDFRKAEQQTHLDQVMLSRPMTTANWVIGKYMGVVSALVVLNLVFLGLSTVGRIVKVYMLGIPFNMIPAVEYFVIITLPSILFMAALVYFLISLLRVQALAIVIPLGYVAFILFSVQHQYEGLLDYGCFMAPFFHSDLIGYGNMDTLLRQRVFFLLAGFALLCGAVMLYPRLRQSDWSPRITATGGVVFLIGAVITGMSIWSNHKTEIETIRTDLAAQAQWVDKPLVRVTHYDFDITLRGGADPLQVVARMAVLNPYADPVDTLVFALNGALRVDAFRWTGGDGIDARQTNQLLIVALKGNPLQPGAVETLTVSYAGHIDADAFMMDRIPDDRGVILKSGDGPWRKDNLSAWLDGEVAVLPSQCGWYPVPGAAAGYPFDAPRPANFATASLRIYTPSDVKAVTQGVLRGERIEGDQAHTLFEVTEPSPAFSLNAGRYQRLTRRFAQTEVAVYFYEGHLLNYDTFSDVADTCYQTVERLFEMYESVAGAPYPYPRLSLVEVPLQMQVYTTRHGVDNVMLQPGVIMVDEIRLAGRRFDKSIERALQNARRGGRDDTEWRIKRDVFIRTVMDILMPDRERMDGSLYTPVRNYYHFRMDLAHPVLDRALELQLYEGVERLARDTFFPDRWNTGLSTNDQLRRNEDSTSWSVRRRYDTEMDSVLTALQRTPLMALRPEKEGNLYRAVLDFKTPPVMDMLQDWAGKEAYRNTLTHLRTERLYQRITVEDFLSALQAHTTADVRTFAHQWFEETTFPGYRITRAETEKWDTGRMQIAYETRIRVQNGEAGDGFVRVELKTRKDRIRRPLKLNSYEEKEMRIVTSDVPEQVQVIPFYARNRGMIMSPITLGQRLQKGTPSDTVFAVQSTKDSLDFILDDQDAGFFMPHIAEARYLRPQTRLTSWRQLTRPQAYGRYIFGFRYRWESTGDFPVRWETTVPRSGQYEISMYMPPRQAMQRRFNVTIEAADGKHEVTIHPQGTKAEWWPVGRFPFDRDQTAAIELSDKGKGYILADAVRWTYVK